MRARNRTQTADSVQLQPTIGVAILIVQAISSLYQITREFLYYINNLSVIIDSRNQCVFIET